MSELLSDGGELLSECGDKLLCGLVVGVVGRVEIGKLMVERLFDVVESVVGFDNVGYPACPAVVVPEMRRRLYAVAKCDLSASHVWSTGGLPSHSVRAWL